VTPSVPASEADSQIRISRLSGGLRVVTESMPSSRSVAVGCWVGVGNRDEPAGVAGVSHFLEHLLFKGSSTRSAREIAEGIDAVGGDLNAFTSKEYTAFHSRVAARDMDFALDTILDVIADPGFSDAEVEAERHVILEELAWNADTPDDVVHGSLTESLFPSHPLGWEVLGTSETVNSIRPDDIRSFHDRWYCRSNLVVAVTGPVDHDQIVERVDTALGGVDGGARPVRTAPGSIDGSNVSLIRPIEQSHIAMGWRAIDQTDPDRFALAVGNQVLGGGWSSRLFQEIRERRGMSYSVFSSVGAFCDSGTLSIYGGTNPGRAAEFCSVVEELVADVVQNGPSDREMEIARGGFEGATILALEGTGSRMSRLATSVLIRDRVVPVDEYLELVRVVTGDDVMRVLGSVVAGSRCVSIVGPEFGSAVSAPGA